MLFYYYITLPLKQLVRIKMAFFFTIIFPVFLYGIYGQGNHILSLLSFVNFTMQSAMLQSVGIFISAQKNTAWGDYVATLPATYLYPVVGIIVAMFIIGTCGLLLILSADIFLYHNLSLNQLGLVFVAATLGSIPMGAIGYLIGITFDPASARNILTFLNLIFLFITFVPDHIQSLLAYISLPNAWLQFSNILIKYKYFHLYSFCIISLYFLIFALLIKVVNTPKKQFSTV